MFPCLDVSAHAIQADSAWRHRDPLGVPLTGKGMRISDFDTGIDVFHPSFFYADGDTFNWIDVDFSTTFTPGVDCVDLNRNGVANANEILSYFDGRIYDPAHVWGTSSPSNLGNGYQTSGIGSTMTRTAAPIATTAPGQVIPRALRPSASRYSSPSTRTGTAPSIPARGSSRSRPRRSTRR